MKLEYKMDKGVIEVTLAGASLDMDKDGKPSIKAAASLEIGAYELINEIAKKDIPFLESVLAQAKLQG